MQDVNFLERYVLSNYVYKEFESVKQSRNLFKHQPFLSSLFGNIYSNLNEVLLFHEMGVGKTCTSVHIAERILSLYSYEYKGVIVITRGQSLVSNFISEIANKCTNGKYVTYKHQDNVTEKTKHSRIRRNINEVYTFFTFEVFAKILKDLSTTTMTQRFENHVIIIDEVHNIRHADNNTSVKIYDEIHRFLHTLKHRKIILLSGTPMRDSCEEIANVMNLILPLDQQMPTNHHFVNKFFNQNNELVNTSLLKSCFKNRISFLKSQDDVVEKRYMGSVVAPLTKLALVCLPMSDHQNLYYEKAWKLDAENVNIYSNVRQASLYVDESGNFGRQSRVPRNLDHLERYSCKYAYVIDRLNDANDKRQLSMVYADFIHGSGLFTLCRLMEQAGYTQQINQPKSYILLTSQTSDAKKQHLIDLFNSSKNCRGDIISVIVGSRVISEGFTLKNVQHEHILTPHWNYSETSQVIARGWRNSHDDLIAQGETPVLHIYQYAAIPTTFPSIDVIMYKTSEEKDTKIQKVTKLMKETAIDCFMLKERNEHGVDFSRECQYESCEFRCDDEPTSDCFTNYSNFDLSYYVNSDLWNTHLEFFKTFFKTRWCVTWTELVQLQKQISMNDQQMVKIIRHLTTFFVLTNPNGNYSHCNFDDIGVYLMCLYDNRCPYFYNYLFSKYETYPASRFQSLALNHYLKDIDNSLYEIVTHPSVGAVVNSPRFVQKSLLQHVIRLRAIKATRFQALQRIMMSHYKLSLFESNDYMGYKFSDNDMWCIEKSTGLTGDVNIVTKHFSLLKKHLETNEFGCYGQENRNLGEFCIKVIEKDSYTVNDDKRKVHSGRRCVNWHKNDLHDLLKNKLKIVDASVDKMSRIELCQTIRQFFQKHNLVENDDTCGTQYKRKSGKD